MHHAKSNFFSNVLRKEEKAIAKCRPIYLRITCYGRSAETSLKRGIPSSICNQSRQRVSDKSKIAVNINHELDSIRGQVHNYKIDLQEQQRAVNARSLMDPIKVKT